mmetsp:Transcript_80986/g.177778  ORF Transcript_80986/g.177778 Transcript_80986/m.177778 type:complete len:107 (+) Transcript_80986:145-465(+)
MKKKKKTSRKRENICKGQTLQILDGAPKLQLAWSGYFIRGTRREEGASLCVCANAPGMMQGFLLQRSSAHTLEGRSCALGRAAELCGSSYMIIHFLYKATSFQKTG